MRKFETGAIRSPATGKVEYYGFRHPRVELSFGQYMEQHQTMENGEKRTSKNWWGGWDTEVSLQSLVRHTEDLQALQAGYKVYKERGENGEVTHYLSGTEKPGAGWVECDAIETANAIKFNANAFILQKLKDGHVEDKDR